MTTDTQQTAWETEATSLAEIGAALTHIAETPEHAAEALPILREAVEEMRIDATRRALAEVL